MCVAAASRGVTVAGMPAGSGLAPFADVPDRERRGPKKCGFWGWSCDDYSDHEKKWRDCAKARENLMRQCFGGGNKTHRDQEYEARLRAWECEKLWIKWCWEPPPTPMIACCPAVAVSV